MNNAKWVFNQLKIKKVPTHDIYEIMEFIFNINKNEIILNFDDVYLNKEQHKLFLNVLKKINKNIPIAYIVNRKYFYKDYFYVDKNVLIPRNDTEILLENIQDYIKSNNNLNILDLCTGSGCIGLSVANINKNNNVLGVDISRKAIRIANWNKKQKNINNIKFIKSNFLNFVIKNNYKFNVIICNPPYISVNDKDIDDNVVKFEPKLALFAKNNGLFYYEEIFKNIENIIDKSQDFIISLEIGWKQKKDLLSLMKKYNINYNYEFKKDYNDNYRNLIIRNF